MSSLPSIADAASVMNILPVSSASDGTHSVESGAFPGVLTQIQTIWAATDTAPGAPALPTVSPQATPKAPAPELLNPTSLASAVSANTLKTPTAQVAPTSLQNTPPIVSTSQEPASPPTRDTTPVMPGVPSILDAEQSTPINTPVTVTSRAVLPAQVASTSQAATPPSVTLHAQEPVPAVPTRQVNTPETATSPKQTPQPVVGKSVRKSSVKASAMAAAPVTIPQQAATVIPAVLSAMVAAVSSDSTAFTDSPAEAPALASLNPAIVPQPPVRPRALPKAMAHAQAAEEAEESTETPVEADAAAASAVLPLLIQTQASPVALPLMPMMDDSPAVTATGLTPEQLPKLPSPDMNVAGRAANTPTVAGQPMLQGLDAEPVAPAALVESRAAHQPDTPQALAPLAASLRSLARKGKDAESVLPAVTSTALPADAPMLSPRTQPVAPQPPQAMTTLEPALSLVPEVRPAPTAQLPVNATSIDPLSPAPVTVLPDNNPQHDGMIPSATLPNSALAVSVETRTVARPEPRPVVTPSTVQRVGISQQPAMIHAPAQGQVRIEAEPQHPQGTAPVAPPVPELVTQDVLPAKLERMSQLLPEQPAGWETATQPSGTQASHPTAHLVEPTQAQPGQALMRDMPSTLSAQQIAMQSVAPFAPTDAVAALAVEQSAPIQPVNETVMVAATRAIPIAKVPQALPDVVTPAPAASDSVRPEPTLAQPSVAPFVPGAAPLPFAVVVRDDDTSSTQRSVPFVASAAATVSIPPVLTISSVATPLVVLEAAEVTAIPAVAQHSTQAGVVPSASHTAHAPQVSVDTTWQPLVAGKLHEPSVLPQVAPPAQLQSLQTSFDEQHVIPASIENADASIVPPNSANFAEESAPLAISTVVLPELLTGRVHSLTHEEPAVTLLHQTMPLSHAVETPAVVAASMPEQVTAAPAQTLPNTTDIDAIISAVAVSPQAPESEAPPATVAAVHERSPASDIRVTPPVVALSPAQLAAPITVEAAPTAAPADDAINMAGNASLASTAGMVAPATTAAPVAPRMKATASIRMSAPVISGSEMTVVASAAPMTTGVTADDSSLPGSQTIIEVQARAQEPIGMPRQGEHDAASVEHDMRTASSIDDLVNTPSRQAGQHQDDQRTISEAFLSSMAGPVSSSHTAAPAEVREPAALEPESIIRQVAVQVRRVATEMPREITVRLDPPMLGTLHVTVQERNGELVARIESPHQAVCQSLDQRLPELRQALEDAGIRVSNCQVSLNMQSGREGQPQWQLAQQGHRDWHPQPMVPGNPQTDDGVEHPAVLPSVEKMRLLDLFA